MSVFSRLDRMVSRTTDRLNGERFQLLPMKASEDPNGRRQPDPDRPQATMTGILDLNPGPFGVEIGNRHVSRENSDFRSAWSGNGPFLSVEAGSLSPQQGDIVRFIDRAGAPEYRVVECQPDGESRSEMRLVRL